MSGPVAFVGSCGELQKGSFFTEFQCDNSP